MERWGTVNVAQHLSITDWEGRSDLYPLAYIIVSPGQETSVPLVHIARGLYRGIWIPTVEGQYDVVVVIYSDLAHTIEQSERQRGGWTFFINSVESDIDNLANGGFASQVWDEILPGVHEIPNSAGRFVQAIRETVFQTSNELFTNAVYSLPNLEQKIMDTRQILYDKINVGEVKVDNLTTQENNHYLDVVQQIGVNRMKIDAIPADILTAKNDVIAELLINRSKIDAVADAILHIQNNTRFIGVVPATMIRPASGTKRYQFFLAIYDTIGQPEAVDVVPTVRIVRSNGTIVLPETDMQTDGIKVGQFYFNYDINAGSDDYAMRIEFKIIEAGITLYLSRVSEITSENTSLATLEAKIDIIDSNVDDIKADVRGGDGLSVLSSKIDNVVSEVNQNEALLLQIRQRTNIIPDHPATEESLSLISNKLDSKPDITAIQNRLNIQNQTLMGPDMRNLTQVYNNERGTDNALLANDPRLVFLDAAISSRSTLTAQQVWEYSTRTLTGSSIPLSDTDVAKIWNYLTSAITTSGSIGKYILDYLDAKVSTRSTLKVSDLTSAISGLALESTLSTMYSNLANDINQSQVTEASILSILNLIKPQTDKIVNDGARQTELMTAINYETAMTEALTLLVEAIKAKTDFLSADIARQSSLLLVPTNPLLANDYRLALLQNLTRLDVAVSTRATSFPTDYAKQATLVDGINTLSTEISQVESSVLLRPTSTQMDAKLVRLDTILLELSKIEGAGFDTLLHSLVKIKQAVGSSGGSSITAADVWNYINRTLTYYPESSSSAELDAAKIEIISGLMEYSCEMTTTINQTTDTQEVLCWLDAQGITLSATTNARVTVNDGATDLWSDNSPLPNSKGVFRISKSSITALISDPDKNYTISITIHYNGQDYTTVRPFYTVG
jgi:hypothetical protein